MDVCIWLASVKTISLIPKNSTLNSLFFCETGCNNPHSLHTEMCLKKNPLNTYRCLYMFYLYLYCERSPVMWLLACVYMPFSDTLLSLNPWASWHLIKAHSISVFLFPVRVHCYRWRQCFHLGQSCFPLSFRLRMSSSVGSNPGTWIHTSKASIKALWLYCVFP